MWDQCKSWETNIVAETEDLFPFGIKTASFQGVSLLVNHVLRCNFQIAIHSLDAGNVREILLVLGIEITFTPYK